VEPAGWPVVRALLEGAAMLLELGALAVIVGGGAWALAKLARRRDLRGARQAFSQALLFALDFTIGADILKVAAAPDLATVAVVGAVVAVRIALTFALLWEIGKDEARERGGRGNQEDQWDRGGGPGRGEREQASGRG
jgi:uncharacterized membrane protein